MTKIKNIIESLILLIIVLSTLWCLIACGNKEENTITKQNLVGEWREDASNVYGASLEFSEKGDMKFSHEEEHYTHYGYYYTIDDSIINIENSPFCVDIYNKKYEFFMPKKVSIEIDGKLKCEFKDGTTMYFTKVSDTTYLDLESEYKKRIEIKELFAEKERKSDLSKSATREFAKKYFSDKSIKVKEVENSERRISEAECVFENENGKYIYVFDKNYSDKYENIHLEREIGYSIFIKDDFMMFSEEIMSCGMWVGYNYKYMQIDNYIFTELDEYDEILKNTGFEHYLFFFFDNENAKKCNYEDIVRINCKLGAQEYLLDLKENKCMTNIYNKKKILKKDDIEKIIDTIKNADVHNWKEYYDEEHTITDHFYTTYLRIEYKDGSIENHCSYSGSPMPDEFSNIMKILDNMVN